MAFLVHPLPSIRLFVKEEYLHDHKSNHGKYTEGIWVSVKSVPGKALYFETLLPEYGALYDKLPISAFCWKIEEKEKQYPLDVLQLWDCLDYHITVIKKPILSNCSFRAKNSDIIHGEYLFTIDNCHENTSYIDTNFSEYDSEHKSFNVIKLNNGQFAAQPNNRVIWYDNSLIPESLKTPTFKVCTQDYKVEPFSKYRFGDTEEWAYKTSIERD